MSNDSTSSIVSKVLSSHTTPCQRGRFFMGGEEGVLERVEQAGHGGFEGTEEFRSRGSGA